MDIYKATEQAYKNGYEKGRQDAMENLSCNQTCNCGKVIMDVDKECAMNMLQFTLDLIREHRRECGLDVTMWPYDGWTVKAYNYIITGLKCYTEEDKIGPPKEE